MAQENTYPGEVNSEIDALFGIDRKTQPDNEEIPDYSDLFDGSPLDDEQEDEFEVNDDVDLNVQGFPEITQFLEEVPHLFFDDPNYYKTALAGEGDISQRVHGILQKFLNTKDPKDRSVYRQQLIPIYWEFLSKVARKAPGKMLEPKKNLLRFGLLHPSLLTQENKQHFAKVIINNDLNQPVYYLDEWFKAVGTGLIRPSTTDEAKIARSNTAFRMKQLLDKAQGKLDGTRVLLKAKDEQRISLEKILNERVAQISEHYPMGDFPDISASYTETQKRIFNEIQEILKNLLKSDRELQINLRDFREAEQDVRTLQQKVEEEGGAMEVDVKALDTEFDTVRQMAKMTIGRQGNHFPILIKEYYHVGPNDLATRENVISTLAWIESIDAEAYCRSYKNRMNRIVPYVILIPSYGDYGRCWEPFDKYNRATSRGRIAIPMYPKNLQIAILAAVADFRWQVAKEKASYYWMEEGITGNYYQYFQKMKLKGDVKESFISDYIIWMTKESEGTQRMDKELRGAFWRHIPFAQPIKDKLRNRSYIYQELYQRDLNRAMSDGY